MKRQILTILLLFLTMMFGLVLSFGLWLIFGFVNLSDWIVANTIPRYPNTPSWNITASSGFPDSIPMARVNFTTVDLTDDIFAFYRRGLNKLGWEEGKSDKPENVTRCLSFQKNLVSTYFSTKVCKQQSLYQRYDTASIIVTHGR